VKGDDRQNTSGHQRRPSDEQRRQVCAGSGKRFNAACRSSSSPCQLRSTVALPMTTLQRHRDEEHVEAKVRRALNHSTTRQAVWAGS